MSFRSTFPGLAGDPLRSFLGRARSSVSLNALSLSANSAVQGEAASIGIIGTMAGSVLTLASGSLPTGMTLNSAGRVISGTPSSASTFNFSLRETLDGVSNSPRDTALGITVGAAGSITPLSLSTFLMPDTATAGTPLITLSGGVASATVTLEDDLIDAQAGALQVSGNVIQAGANFAALRHGTYRLGIRMIAGATERYYETFVTKYAAGDAAFYGSNYRSCTTEIELTNALADAVTAGGALPFVIDLSSATVWAARAWSIIIPPASHRVIIRTLNNHISGTRARIDRANMNNVRATMFQNTEHVSLGVPGNFGTAGFGGNLQASPCVSMGGSPQVENVEFFRCRVAGGFQADRTLPLDPTQDIDPAGRDYPGYAGFLCNFPTTAGAVGTVASPTVPAGLTIWPSFVTIAQGNTSVRNLTFNANPALNEQVYIGNNTPDGALDSPGNGGWPTTGGYTLFFRAAQWSDANVNYALNAIVQRNGVRYNCTTAHTSNSGNGPPGANWTARSDEAVARFRVENGWITGFIVDNWGGGYINNAANGTGHPALTTGWPNRLTMWNRLVNGISNIPNLNGLKITESVFENLLNAIGSTCPLQEQVVACTMRNIYADFMGRFSDAQREPVKESIIAWNVMHSHFGATFDNPNVHGDFGQTRTTFANSHQRFQWIGNLCDVGNARGAIQGLFFSDNFTLPQVPGVPSQSFLDATIVGNVIRTSLTNGLAIVTGRDVLAWRNLFIGHPTKAPASGVSGYGAGSSIASAIIDNRTVGQGAIVLIDNAANTTSIPTNPLIVTSNQQNVGNVSSYASVFSASTDATLTTPAAFKAALTSAGALATAGAGVWLPGENDPIFNHEQRYWQPERAPIVVPFGKRGDIARSALTTSPIRRVWRGKKTAGLSISVSAGCEWQSANNPDMSGIIQDWTSSPGTVAYGKYYRVRHTASSGYYSLTTSTVTINGVANSFQTLTEDVDNGGPVAPGATSNRSSTGTSLGAANVYAKYIVLAVKFRTQASFSGMPSCRLFTLGNARTTMLVNSAGACTLTINGRTLNLGNVIKANTEHTLIIHVDRTIVSPGINPADDTLYNVYPGSVRVILDGADVTPLPEPGTDQTARAGNGTTGSNGIEWFSGSGVDGTGFSDNTLVFATNAALIGDRVALFSSAATTPIEICPAGWKIHWLAVDWDTTTRPAVYDPTHVGWLDIRDDAIITKFSNDRILAAQAGDATQWPLQRPWKVLYQPTVAEMNGAGSPNKGSLTLNASNGLVVKIGTGNYT